MFKALCTWLDGLSKPFLYFAEKLDIDIEDYLINVSNAEKDELTIALAAGRYASMKLAKLTGEESTKKFFNECIKTTLKQNILQ